MIWRASSLTWELFVLECLQRASGSKTSNLSIYLHHLVSSVTIINESCTCGCWEDVLFIEQVSFFKSWCLFPFSEMCFSGGKQMSRSHESRFNITAWTWPDLHCDELPAHRRFITLSSQLPAKTLQRLMTQTKIGLFVAAGAIQEKSKYTLQFCGDPQHMHQRTGEVDVCAGTLITTLWIPAVLWAAAEQETGSPVERLLSLWEASVWGLLVCCYRG